MSEKESHNVEQTGKVFSEDYVKSLREEAAGYRTKVRDLEGKLFQSKVSGELQEQGIKAEASWVEVQEGESVKAAVSRFKESYPHLAAQPEPTNENPVDKLTKRRVKVEGQRPMPPASDDPEGKRQNTPGSLNSRNVNELKEDPEARAEIRDAYREMLRKQGHRD